VLYQYYRCQEHFEGLIGWLRTQGLRSKKPLHELRKSFGSLINQKAGIHAASRAFGLGHLISTDKVVSFEQQEVA
jgi:hypothetical protein